MQIFREFRLGGCWMIKWIDGLRIGSASRRDSPKIHVLLQYLGTHPGSHYLALSEDEVASVVGAHGERDADSRYEVCAIDIGLLPALSIGDIVVNGERCGRLRQCTSSFEAWGPSSVIQAIGFVLPLEVYPLGRKHAMFTSNCEVAYDRDTNTEFIIPHAVMFKVFYGFSSKLIKALFSGSWHETASNLIATGDSEGRLPSGRFTGIDEDGNWNIILRIGTPAQEARRLALLWCDYYGRKTAASIWLRNVSHHHDGFSYGPCAVRAEVPFPIEERPLKVRARGLVLPSPSGQRRVLVTDINGYHFPYSCTVRYAHDWSSEPGEEIVEDEVETQTSFSKPPVEGIPGAVVTTEQEPDAGQSVNEFSEEGFEFLNQSDLAEERQKKQVSHRTSVSRLMSADEPATVVSGAFAHHGQEASVASGEFSSLVGKSVPLFAALIQALERLKTRGHIQSFDVVAPRNLGGNQSLAVSFPGLECWSLVEETRNGSLPKHGWEVIKTKTKATRATGSTESTPARQRRRARSLLAIRVRIGGSSILLFEIEPWPQDNAFSMLLVKEQHQLTLASMRSLLREVVKRKGILRPHVKGGGTERFGIGRAEVAKHAYVDGQGTMRALQEQALLRRLESLR